MAAFSDDVGVYRHCLASVWFTGAKVAHVFGTSKLMPFYIFVPLTQAVGNVLYGGAEMMQAYLLVLARNKCCGLSLVVLEGV